MPKPNFLLLLPVLIFAGLIAVFALGLGQRGDDTGPNARVGQPAPALFMELLSGPVFTNDDLSGDGVKVVNFWASWCAPCRAEHPNLEQLSAEGYAVYGVNYRDQPDDARAFLAELGNPFAAVGADPSARTALEWGVSGVPETYIIDGNGEIVLRFAGPITQRSLESMIRPALERAGGTNN